MSHNKNSKNSKNNNNSKNSKTSKIITKPIEKKIPFVSICTPTFNRRPFFPFIIKCFENQDYPKDKLEWIIIDDGTDPIGDLVSHIPQVKYFRYEQKMSLGKKRNIMHDKSSGDFLVYMDDDDYYPSDRVSHAIETLEKNPNALCAGSSEMYIYFKHIHKMIQFGPYGPKHSTAATFAFRRELLKQTRYDDNSCVAEEKKFLKDYTIPFVQLDPMKCILVFSHVHNSFDKKTLLNTPNQFVKESIKKPIDFVKEPEILTFFMHDIDKLLDEYNPGRPEHKPDVLKQIEEIKIEREKMQLQMQQQQQQPQQRQVTQEQLQEILNNYEKRVQELTLENTKINEQNKYFNKKISELIKAALEKAALEKRRQTNAELAQHGTELEHISIQITESV